MQAALKNTILTKHAMQVFNVSHMALFLWRKGTATKEPLPVVEIEGSREVRFKCSVLKTWAKANGVEIFIDPMSFVGAPEVKRGPKVAAKKAKPVAKKKVAVKAARKRHATSH